MEFKTDNDWLEKQVNYYATIPATVRYDDELTSSEKLFYGEITALSNRYGYCFANNNYFSKLYKVAERTITRWINKLEEKGYITRMVIYGNNNEFKERRLYLKQNLSVGVDTDVSRGTDTDVSRGTDTDVRDNNTSINNTSINNIYVHFDVFWKEYPKKVTKTESEKKFIKICKNEQIFKEIMEGLKKHKELNWNYIDKQFIPNPLTWLNQERWKDDVIDLRPKTPTKQKEYKETGW